MIEYLETIYHDWLGGNSENLAEPLVCTVCYEQECEHYKQPKWPISHVINKLKLDEELWSRKIS